MQQLPASVLIAVLLTACAGSSTDGVRPFSDIAAADPRVDFDPSGTVATLHVTTDIEAICAVAYGTDGPSGAIATDQDMDTDGHRDHAAVMTGLEPETTYQYRLQGVGADGELYRSEVFTFTTPAGSTTSPDVSENVAVGARVVDVSSEFSATFAAANAVDGDPGTEWSSNGDGDDAFITIDLGRTMNVTAVAFQTRSMGDGSSITETFNVLVNGETFGPLPAGADPVTVDFSGQTLTFEVESSTGGNTGAVEVQVFAG